MNNASNTVGDQEEIKILAGFRAMNNEQKNAYLSLVELLSEDNNDDSGQLIEKLHDNFPELKNTTFFEDLSDYVGSKDETAI